MEKNVSGAGPGQMAKKGMGALLAVLLALLAAGALSVPFVYESQTLWYKVGYEKTLLRAGQLAGLAAAVSLVVQMLRGVRGRLLEEIYGSAQLTRRHRLNGLVLISLGFLHAALVLLTEELRGLLVFKAWPELVGGLLLLAILSMVVSSLFRGQIGVAYGRWRIMHRTLAYLAPLLLAVHVLFVSDSFVQWVPKAGLLTILAVLAVTILRIKLARRGRA